MIENDIILRIVVNFDPEKAPFSNFRDIVEMMKEFIERDFVVNGVEISSVQSYMIPR